MHTVRFVSLAAAVLVSLALGGCVTVPAGTSRAPAASPASQEGPSDDLFNDNYSRWELGTRRVARPVNRPAGTL